MKKFIIISILPLIFGCASQGFITAEMSTHMKRIQAQDIPFMITNMGISKSNSVGGRDVWMHPMITSKKIIKYIYPTFIAYNEVQDEVICSIKNSSTFTGTATGPYNFGEKEYFKWSNAYYNFSIHCIKLLSIKIEYMDNSTAIYEGDNIPKLYAPEKFRTKSGNSEYSKYGTVCNW